MRLPLAVIAALQGYRLRSSVSSHSNNQRRDAPQIIHMNESIIYYIYNCVLSYVL